MYRRSRFLIGFLAAALTFGGLMATLGPEHFHRAWHRHHRMDNCCMYNEERMNSCDEPERFERYERHERTERVVTPMQEMKKDSVKK
jgi:hypothetical protein